MILCNSETPRRRVKDPFNLPFLVCVYAQGHKGTSPMSLWGGAILLPQRVKFLVDFILEKIKALKKKGLIGRQPHKFIFHIVFALSIRWEDFSQF